MTDILHMRVLVCWGPSQPVDTTKAGGVGGVGSGKPGIFWGMVRP